MFKRDEFPIETGFGMSGTTPNYTRITELIKNYTDSILKLKNEINEFQNFNNNSKIISAQFSDDIQYILTYKQQLSSTVQQLKLQYPQNAFNLPLQDPNNPYFQGNLQPGMTSDNSNLNSQSQQNNSAANNNYGSPADFQYKIESNNKFFNNNTVIMRYLIDVKDVICTVHFDSTGKLFAFSSSRTLHVVDTQSGQVLCSAEICGNIPRIEAHSRDLKFSPDGTIIAVAIAPTLIGIFSLVTKTIVATLDGHVRSVSALLFSSDSTKLISGGADGIICVWDLKTFQPIKKLQNGTLEQDALASRDGSIGGIVAGPNDSYFAVGFSNGIVIVFDSQMNESYQFQAHSDMILSMSITPKGELITASADKSLKVWQLSPKSVSPGRVIEGHTDFVTCCCTSLTNKIVLSGSKDETIRAWNFEKNLHLFTARVHRNTVLGITHHPKENIFITSSGDGYVIGWSYHLPPT